METSPGAILVAALLPAAVLLGFIFLQDKQRPEPPRQLLRAFLAGVGSVFVSLMFTLPLSLVWPRAYTDSVGAMCFSFGMAAIPEELAKLFMLWLVLRRNPWFDEHLDGIVYAVCVGMGFAATENLTYLFQAGDMWLDTALARGLLAVPGHFFFAVLMGYYYSRVHFGHASLRNRILVLAAPVLAHGIYDSLCMAADVVDDWLHMVFVGVLLLFCNELRKLCSRHIREQVRRDRDMHSFSS